MNAAFLPGAEWLPLLAQLALKATLILLVTALAAAALWRSSAAVRHMVWCVGVAGVLALPFFAAVLPAWEVPVLPAPSTPAVTAPAPAATNAQAVAELEKMQASAPAVPAAPPSTADAAANRAAWLPHTAVRIAVAGVIAGLLWLALGFWGVARLGKRAQVVRDPEWLRTVHDAAERLGLRRPVLLLRARGAVMPATGGLLWPSVVLPASADEWPDERRHAVLAHELAHVKRFDTLTQALAQVACVLFWWHPAVWYAARRLRVERERACDDLVLRAGTRASDYAAHLLEIARTHRGPRLARAALVSMARPSQLESRLLWVLDAARSRGVPTPRATLLTVAAALLIVAPLAAVRPAQASAARGDDTGSFFGAVLGEDEDESPVAAADDARHDLAHDKKADARDKVKDRVVDKAHDRVVRAGDTIPEVDDLVAMAAVGVNAAYIAELRDAGYGNLTARQLVSLRAVGVTGRYAREMDAAGFGRMDVQDLVGMRSMGVTPAYLADLRRYGFTILTAEQVKGMAGVGVNGGYLDALRRLGYTGLSATEVTGMRAVGVNAAYIEQMNAAGLGRLSPEQLTSLRALGVTPAYLRELEGMGLRGLSIDDVQGLRAMNVDAAYVAAMREAGLQGLDAETLTGLRAVGVTPDYVRGMAAAGLTGLTTRQLMDLRANGVTPAYIRELDAAGFRRLNVEELVRLRTSGVDRELIRSRGEGSKQP